MIIQRTQEDKAVARATAPDFRENRPLKFDTEQLDYTQWRCSGLFLRTGR